MTIKHMIITVHHEVYPLETILQTCYQLMDQAYFHIDLDEPGKRILVKVSFKSVGANKAHAKEFRSKFLEELLYSSLRYTINQRNQKLREYIVASALFSHDPAEAALTPSENIQVEKKTTLSPGPLNDPLGIAVPWEQYHGQ